MSLISVNNLTITKTSIIFNIKLEVIELILFESCEFRIILFDEENNIIDVLNFIKFPVKSMLIGIMTNIS